MIFLDNFVIGHRVVVLWDNILKWARVHFFQGSPVSNATVMIVDGIVEANGKR